MGSKSHKAACHLQRLTAFYNRYCEDDTAQVARQTLREVHDVKDEVQDVKALLVRIQ